MESAFLMNYLNDDNFSQNLISRQDEIDDVLRDHIKRKYREQGVEIERNSVAKEKEIEMGNGEEEESKAVGYREGATLPMNSPYSGLLKY